MKYFLLLLSFSSIVTAAPIYKTEIDTFRGNSSEEILNRANAWCNRRQSTLTEGVFRKRYYQEPRSQYETNFEQDFTCKFELDASEIAQYKIDQARIAKEKACADEIKNQEKTLELILKNYRSLCNNLNFVDGIACFMEKKNTNDVSLLIVKIRSDYKANFILGYNESEYRVKYSFCDLRKANASEIDILRKDSRANYAAIYNKYQKVNNSGRDVAKTSTGSTTPANARAVRRQ